MESSGHNARQQKGLLSINKLPDGTYLPGDLSNTRQLTLILCQRVWWCSLTPTLSLGQKESRETKHFLSPSRHLLHHLFRLSPPGGLTHQRGVGGNGDHWVTHSGLRGYNEPVFCNGLLSHRLYF